MRKTSIYLTDREATRLAALADREGISQAEVVRRAITAYSPEQRGDRNFALVGSGTGPGDSIAEISEEEHLQGFGA